MIKKIFLQVEEVLRRRLRNALLRLVRAFGPMLVDHRTGKKLGRVAMLPWGSRVYVYGLMPDQAVQVRFLTQERLTYWKQDIGFIDMDRNPDEPSLHQPTGSSQAAVPAARRSAPAPSNHDAAHP